MCAAVARVCSVTEIDKQDGDFCDPMARAFHALAGRRHFLTELDTSMAEGTIKRITEKGFGFIDSGTGQDMFFHSSSVEGARFEELREGQRVSFEVGQGPKGPRADNVRLI